MAKNKRDMDSCFRRNDIIRNQIRRLRFDNGEMTQQQLADKVGVTRQTIIAIEAGKYAPSLPLAFRIARIFGLPVEDVFQYEDEGYQSSAADPDA
jgi:putative transcriptional regulator